MVAQDWPQHASRKPPYLRDVGRVGYVPQPHLQRVHQLDGVELDLGGHLLGDNVESQSLRYDSPRDDDRCSEVLEFPECMGKQLPVMMFHVVPAVPGSDIPGDSIPQRPF